MKTKAVIGKITIFTMTGGSTQKATVSQSIAEHAKTTVSRIQIAALLNVKRIKKGCLIVAGGPLENVQLKLKETKTMLRFLPAINNMVRNRPRS